MTTDYIYKFNNINHAIRLAFLGKSDRSPHTILHSQHTALGQATSY